MRGLKALVIGMGVLIVLGMVAMIVAGVRQAGELSAPKAPPAAAAPHTLDIPAGAEIAETRIGDGRIVLRLRLADGTGRLVILDAATGAPTGRVDLRPR